MTTTTATLTLEPTAAALEALRSARPDDLRRWLESKAEAAQGQLDAFLRRGDAGARWRAGYMAFRAARAEALYRLAVLDALEAGEDVPDRTAADDLTDELLDVWTRLVGADAPRRAAAAIDGLIGSKRRRLGQVDAFLAESLAHWSDPGRPLADDAIDGRAAALSERLELVARLEALESARDAFAARLRALCEAEIEPRAVALASALREIEVATASPAEQDPELLDLQALRSEIAAEMGRLELAGAKTGLLTTEAGERLKLADARIKQRRKDLAEASKSRADEAIDGAAAGDPARLRDLIRAAGDHPKAFAPGSRADLMRLVGEAVRAGGPTMLDVLGGAA